jgi:hypothetical protein
LGKDWSRFWSDRFWRPDRPSDLSPLGLGNQDDSDKSSESGEQEGEENGDQIGDQIGVADRGAIDMKHSKIAQKLSNDCQDKA